ncbi:hypothetical protein BGZ63DRAFT_368736, partial [Mariannaea sp. PMI_226]
IKNIYNYYNIFKLKLKGIFKNIDKKQIVEIAINKLRQWGSALIYIAELRNLMS